MAEETKIPEKSEDVGVQKPVQAHDAQQKQHHNATNKHPREFSILNYRNEIFAFILFLGVSLVMFYPIVLHMTTVAPGTGADTYQNLWDIWWVKYALLNMHTVNVFYTKIIFWPIGTNLIYGTLPPLLGLLSIPFQAFGTVFAYNVMFLLGFALSGLTMYILANYLTKNHYAALISGFVFTFSAFHIAQAYSHIHFTNIEWVPLFIYFFLRLVYEDRKWTNVIGMSASFALTTLMGNIEETIMLFFALIFLIAVYIFYKETRKKVLSVNFLVSILAFILLAFVIGAWNFVPLISSVVGSGGGLSTVNFGNNMASNIQWSVSPLGFFVPSYSNGIVYFGGLPSGIYNAVYAPDPVEKVGYIGFTVLALILFAVYKNWKKMLPWIIGAVIFAWLALGPLFGLYYLYHSIPGINVIREPGRFDLVATLFIAILAAYGAKSLFEHFEKQKGHRTAGYTAQLLLVVLLVLMFVESNGLAIGKSVAATTNIQIPKLYYQLSNLTGNFSVLGLPALPVGLNSTYLYPGEDTFYTSISHKPLVGGYSGRPNLSTTLLLYNIPLAVQTSYLIANGTGIYPSPVKENYSNETLLTLFNYNTEFVILHKDAFTQQQLGSIGSYLVSLFGNPVYNDNTTAAFETLRAINSSLFKSFVSYPLLEYWSSTSVFLNGGYQTFWIPTFPGSVAVYAPYQNRSSSSISPYSVSYTNTTISFVAFSNLPQKLYIEEPSTGNRTKVAAEFNVTTSPERYSANTLLISGPEGNILYFVYLDNSSPVLINNITFSR